MGFLDKLLGRKSEPAAVKAQPLNAAEKQLLDDSRTNFRQLAKEAGLSNDPVVDAPRLGDEILRWWHGQPEQARPDANTVVWAIGASIGDWLAAKTGMQWMVVTDAFGTSLALYSKSSGQYSELVLAPVDSVAKRFATAQPNDLRNYAESAAAQIAGMRRQ